MHTGIIRGWDKGMRLVAPAGPPPNVGPVDTPNIAGWWRKGVGGTYIPGTVSSWSDQSGFNRSLNQSAANQPTLAAGVWSFNGTSQYFRPVPPTFTLNQPTTVCIRMRQTSWTSGAVIFDGNGASSGMLSQSGVSPQVVPSAGGAFGSSASPALGVWSSVVVVFNGASSVMNVDGVETTGNAGAGNMGGITLGCQGGAVNFANFDTVEMILYSDAKNPATRTALINYLNTL